MFAQVKWWPIFLSSSIINYLTYMIFT
jgi:hypothetical protein